MKINGRHYRTIWPNADGTVEVIDQTYLPHRFTTRRLTSLDAASAAIRAMVVRGAPLIGATAAYGMALAMRVGSSDKAVGAAHDFLLEARPTAVNLRWALARVRTSLLKIPPVARVEAAWVEAAAICDEDVETCRRIGVHGLELFRAAAAKKPGRALNILTHCNAGWLA